MAQDAGQTFTTGTLGSENALSTIAIFGDSGGAANASSVQARLFLDTDGDFETWDPGALVATSTTSQVIAATDTLFTFNFSNETLSDNTVYVLSFYDGISDHVAFASDVNSTGSAISDGALFSSANQPFAGLYDAAIRVTTTSVPEVSSLVLGALAGMAAFMGLRHR